MAQSLVDPALNQTSDHRGEGRDTPLTAAPQPPGELGPEILPRTFGRYELRRLLGRGAMGAVYLAHDAQLDRGVALKIPRAIYEDPAAWRERFLSEARAAATLHHPNICPVFEVGEVESQPYLTMAYIEGETLAARLRRDGTLAVGEAVELVRTISRAMAEAHERGIVHRDLKPANIMLDRRGQPVIMDFGLALRAAENDDLRLTLSGVALGTPCYMPPEQAGGDHAAIGPPADVYSLGVILFELVTGQVPFQGRTFGKLLAQIERDEPPSPQTINPAIDDRLGGVILRALSKTPEARFASAAEFADALDAYVAGATSPAGARLVDTSDWKVPRADNRTAAASFAPAMFKIRVWAAVALGIVGLILLGVILYVTTDYGDLVVDLSDPNAQVKVKVNGDEVILDPEGEPVRIRAGKNQRLEVSGDGYKTTGKTFDLKRGKKTVVSVKLVPIPPHVGDLLPPPTRVVFPAPALLIEMPGWQLATGADQELMQAWLSARKRDSHSVLWLDAAMIDDEPVFAAVAALDGRASDWTAFLDLTELEVNDIETISRNREWHPSNVPKSIGGYVQGQTLTGVALYHRGTVPTSSGVLNEVKASEALTKFVKEGYVARAIRPIMTSSGQLFCGLSAESAVNTRSRHAIGLSEAGLTQMLDAQRAEGAYPESVVPYEAKGQRRFAVTFREDSTKAPWRLTRDLTAEDLQSKAAELSKKQFVPVSIHVYSLDGEARYAVVWRQAPPQEKDSPP